MVLEERYSTLTIPPSAGRVMVVCLPNASKYRGGLDGTCRHLLTLSRHIIGFPHLRSLERGRVEWKPNDVKLKVYTAAPLGIQGYSIIAQDSCITMDMGHVKNNEASQKSSS